MKNLPLIFVLLAISASGAYVYVRRSAQRQLSAAEIRDVLAQGGAKTEVTSTPGGGTKIVISAPGAAKDSSAPGKNGFIGDSGYLVELPSDYTALPEKKDGLERVKFFPMDHPPKTSDAPGLVLLEVTPSKGPDGRLLATLEGYKAGMLETSRQYGETCSFSATAFALPGFEVTFTHPPTPGALIQVLLQGKAHYYMFSAHDRKLVESFAATLKE